MNFHVINENLVVDFLKVNVVSTSSLLMIGDSKTIQLSAALDIPPEVIAQPSPIVSVAPKG